ncbi:hydantoinase B/oxoprolinase family protein [Microtetraspora malaysiensis]|uniref:hydantoinase B/oxoprolinase family protein n=1 Tax=Microtetraspora malaysiensis TaxID=161358 RepID=UPI00083351A5|nr:hydantoinase B/oxoprolinase family protein [Microtetraspora malaysiensis]
MNSADTRDVAEGRGPDVVTVEVIRSALESLAEQMTETMTRTSYSLLLKEGKDCSSSIFDASGRLVAEGANVPVHLNALGPCLKGMLKHHFPPETLVPGDVILTNDPYVDGSVGAHHTADFIVYEPVFWDGELVGFSTIFAHLAGAGGLDPNDWHTSIFEEGLRIPPVKLYSGGVLDEDLLKLILTNTSVPYAQRGDLLAQVSGAHVGADGFRRLLDRYGRDVVLRAVDAQIQYAERRTAEYIRRIPDGVYRAEKLLLEDGSMGGPVRLRLAMKVTDDRITFDFTGSDEQIAGPINCPKSATISACLFGLLAMMPPDIPKNQGPANLVTIDAPEGSIVNPTPPAAVYQRMAVTHQIVDMIFEAMAEVLPDAVVANSCGLIYGRGSAVNTTTHPDGGDISARQEWRMGTGPSTGGLGARASRDGLSAMPGWITNVASPSIESSEWEAPVLYRSKALYTDSGGAGRWRGGLGLRLSWQVKGEAARFSHTSQYSAIPPKGLFGGHSGAPSRWIVNEGGESEQVLRHQTGPTMSLDRDDTVTLYTPGGGGYGDPLDRDPARVRVDVLDRKVSVEAARDRYGVVFTDAGEVDEPATAERRAALRAARSRA